MPEKTVTIKLAGDASNLNAALQQSLRNVQEFGGTLEKVGKSQGIAFSSAIQQDVKQLEVLRDHLVKINAPAADLEKVTKKLTEAQLKFKDSLKTEAIRAQEKAIDDLRAEMTGAAGSAEQLGAKFKPAAENASLLGSSLGTVKTIAAGLGVTFGALAIANQIREMAGAALDFDKAWTKVSVILRDKPPDVLEDFKRQILELPPAFGTASQNAEAFYQIISSGFSEPADALELLKQSAIGAAGGFTETAIAAKTGAAVLNAYGLEASKAKEVFDVMAKTVDLGVVSFEELSSELGQIVPIAASNNVSFTELSGAISALTLQGLPASQAITGLRSTVTSLLEPSKEAKDTAERLGIAWNGAALKAMGLEGILKQLSGRADVTSTDIANLTGRVEATNAVMALTSKGGAASLEKSLIEIGNASKGAGASAEALAVAQKSLNFQLKEAGNEITNAAAAFGSKLAPALASGVARMREFGKSVFENVGTSIKFFGDLFESAGNYIDVIVKVGQATHASLGPTTSLLSDLSDTFKATFLNLTALTSGVVTFGVAFTALKFEAWVVSIGGAAAAFESLKAGILAASTATGTLSIAIAATGFGIIAAGLSAIAYYAVQAAEAQGEMRVATDQANASLLRLAADSQTKGVPGVADLVRQFNAGAISAGDFQIKLGSLINEFAKLDPGKYFKDSNLKTISALVESIGGTSTGSLLTAAKSASAAVEQIKQRLSSFETGSKEAAIAQAELSKATSIQNQKWDAYKKAMGEATKGTGDNEKANKKAETSAHQLSEKLKTLSKSYGGVEGATLASIQTIKEDIAFLEKNKASTDVLAGAKNKLGQEVLKLIAAESKQPAILKQIATITDDVNATFKGFNVTAGLTEERFERLREITGMTAEEFRQLADFVSGPLDAALRRNISTIDTGVEALNRLGLSAQLPKDAFAEAENAMKRLGVTSDAELRGIAQAAQDNYEAVSENAGSSIREIELAWAASAEAQINSTRQAGGAIDTETQRAVDAIKARYGSLKDDKDANLSTWRELGSKQVSTLVSDVSKGFADILTSTGSFGSKIVSMFKQIGSGIIQAFFESGIGGLLSGKGLAGFGGFVGGLVDSLKGIFGGGTGATAAGGLTSLASLIPGLGGTGTASTLANLGLSVGGTSLLGGLLGGGAGLIGGGVAGGSLASIASAGIAPAFLLSGGTVAGTAGAAGVGTGLASGGAAAGSGSLLSTLGALATNPITIAAAAAIGGALLVRRLTRRGREKEEATGEAEDLRDTVWQDIIPAVESGKQSVDEGIAAVQGAWDAYVVFLNENIKDQTVLNRSIEGQKLTLTEGVAALEAMRDTQLGTEGITGVRGFLDEMARTGEVTDGAIEGLKNIAAEMEDTGLTAESNAAKLGALGAEFFKTGTMTDSFASALTAAGGSPDFFTKMTGEIQKLQGLRQEFGSLKQMIDSLLPVTKSWQEEFMATGIITDEMAEKIKEAGGDLEDFQKFADMQKVKTEFQSLADEFDKTGVVSDRLLELLKRFASPELFEKFLASMKNTSETINATIKSAFDSTGTGIEKTVTSLSLLEKEWTNHKTISADAVAMIRKFADASTLKAFEDLIAESVRTGKSLAELAAGSTAAGTTISNALNSAAANARQLQADFVSLKAEFDQTGVVSDKLLEILRDYSDPAIFKSFEDLIAQAKASGVSIFDLGKQSTAAADIIKAVFGSAGESIEKQFTSAAESLSASLTQMDENLGKSIQSLQNAMVTMIKDLIDVLLDVPGAAEKAARDANYFLGLIHDRDVRVTFSTSAPGLADIEARVRNLGAITGSITATPGYVPPPAPAPPPPVTTTTGSTATDRALRDNTYIPMAEGGKGIVTKPTIFLAGEAGPESFSFVPLNRKSSSAEEFGKDAEEVARRYGYTYGGAFADGGKGTVSKPTMLLAGEKTDERFSFLPAAAVAKGKAVSEFAKMSPAGSGRAISAFARDRATDGGFGQTIGRPAPVAKFGRDAAPETVNHGQMVSEFAQLAPAGSGSVIAALARSRPDVDDFEPVTFAKQRGFDFAGAFAEGGEGIVRTKTIFVAGEAGPERFKFEPLSQMYGKSEALQRASEMSITPAVLASIQRDFARLQSGHSSSSVDNSRQNTNNINMPVNVYGGNDGPFAYHREQERMKAMLVNTLI